MKMFVEPADIYLYMDIVDFRKSINGLIVVVEQEMNLNSFRDALFVFCNKKCDKVKILYWDKTGFALWYKRLEKHRFKWPVDANLQQMHVSEQQLQRLLSGYDVIVSSSPLMRRSHQGKICCGRTPLETLVDGKKTWAVKNLAQI